MKKLLKKGTTLLVNVPASTSETSVKFYLMCNENVLMDLESMIARKVKEALENRLQAPNNSLVCNDCKDSFVCNDSPVCNDSLVCKDSSGSATAETSEQLKEGNLLLPCEQVPLDAEQAKSLAFLFGRFTQYISHEKKLLKALHAVAAATNTNEFIFAVRSILNINLEDIQQVSGMLSERFIKKALMMLVSVNIREAKGSGFTFKNISRRLQALVDQELTKAKKRKVQ